MTRRTWVTLMLALIVAGAWWLFDPMADGHQIIAGWVAVIAAGIVANCRVWPATDGPT